MRVFWASVVVLMVATGGFLAMRTRGGDAAAASPTSLTQAADSASKPPEDAGGGAVVEPTPVAVDTLDEPAPDEVDPRTGVDSGVADASEPAGEPEGEPAPLADDTAVDPADAPTIAEAPAAPEPATPEAAPTLLLNERFKVTGAGTPEDPYRIDFDMLVALEQDYEPKTEGKAEVPEWIKPLDGKHVVVTGFIGFPFIAPTSDECMVMLNQWDGCCIGVPPTPYDAIEVQLDQPIDLSAGVPNYGTIRGVFRTDPYLVNGWLIGLYVMDEARLENAGSKGQAGF